MEQASGERAAIREQIGGMQTQVGGIQTQVGGMQKQMERMIQSLNRIDDNIIQMRGEFALRDDRLGRIEQVVGVH
ncbi:MAG: hypothetical protein QME81_00495 [bacterium]|nr:hypothetical protein [bacterium]